MMTKLPCNKGGTPCAKRHPGCQSKCPDMKMFQLMHAIDLEGKKALQDQHDTTARSVERMRKRKK